MKLRGYRDAASVCALAGLVSVPVWQADFVLDAIPAVAQSPCVTGAFDAIAIFTSNFWCEPADEATVDAWRPIPVLGWWLAWHLGGGAPVLLQALSWLVHAATAWQVVGLGRDLGLSSRAVWLGGLVFAVSPVHVEAVASVVGLADLLSAWCGLLGLRAALAGPGPRLLLLAVAPACKESGLAYALVAVGWAVMRTRGQARSSEHERRFGRRSWDFRSHAAWGWSAATLVALVIVLGVRATVMGGFGAPHVTAYVNPLLAEPWTARLPASLVFLARYHLLTIGASPLRIDYAAHEIGVGAGIEGVEVMLGVLVACGWTGVFVRSSQPGLRALALFFAGSFVAISNLFVLLPAMFAERLFYGASVGVCLGLGAALAWLLERRPGRFLRGVLGLWFVALTLVSWSEAAKWRSEEVLTEHIAERATKSGRAQLWRARHLARTGRLDEARPYVAAARRLLPQWSTPIAYEAVLLDVEGQPKRALDVFRSAFDRDPRDAETKDLFVQFLRRYGHEGPAAAVEARHAAALRAR